jgi:hypothetical protein
VPLAKTPIARRRQKRAVPQTAQITWKGACDYFGPDDAQRVRAIIARQSRNDDAKVAEHMNFIAETYLILYAHQCAPTPDSRAAEWCQALARDIDGLLATLDTPDAGYPAPSMNLKTSIALTKVGIGSVLEGTRLDVGQALDRIPGMLWILKKLAGNAAEEYGKRSKRGRSSDNARQPQNEFLITAVAHMLKSEFGFPLAKSRPSPDGPFIQAVNLVRERIKERAGKGSFHIDQGTDEAAGRRLQSFTPVAAATLWGKLWLKRKGNVLSKFNKIWGPSSRPRVRSSRSRLRNR